MMVKPDQDDLADFNQKINKLRGVRQKKAIDVLREYNDKVEGEIIEGEVPKLTLNNFSDNLYRLYAEI